MSVELVQENTQEIVLDGSNKVSFPGFPYFFTALNEKVLVSLDQFKSGYECRKCKGEGKIVKSCDCTLTDRPGKQYTTTQLADIREALGQAIEEVRKDKNCPTCGGDPKSVAEVITCPECNGKSALLIIPDTAKLIASSGVVVSMGNVAREKADYKIGDRILFSQHAGSLIPTKSGICFKQMDWYQAWVKVDGADELSAFDFIVGVEDSNNL